METLTFEEYEKLLKSFSYQYLLRLPVLIIRQMKKNMGNGGNFQLIKI